MRQLLILVSLLGLLKLFLMRYNSHTRKLTLFKSTVQWFLIQLCSQYQSVIFNILQSYTTITNLFLVYRFFFSPNIFFFLSFKNFTYLIFGCTGSLLLCESYSLVVVQGQALGCQASAVAGCGFGRAVGLSCPEICGILQSRD